MWTPAWTLLQAELVASSWNHVCARLPLDILGLLEGKRGPAWPPAPRDFHLRTDLTLAELSMRVKGTKTPPLAQLAAS